MCKNCFCSLAGVYDLFVSYLRNVEGSLCIQGMSYGYVYFFHFLIFRSCVCWWMVYMLVLCGVCMLWCDCDCVFREMEELILHENLGVWGYVYAGTVALHVYLGHRV